MPGFLLLAHPPRIAAGCPWNMLQALSAQGSALVSLPGYIGIGMQLGEQRLNVT